MPAATLIVTLRLKDGVDRDEYERWAREVDGPTAGRQPSIDDWRLFRAEGRVGSEEPSPFTHIEVVQINDTDQMARDMQSDDLNKMARQLSEYAEPVFVLTQRVV